MTPCDLLAEMLAQSGCGGFKREVKFCSTRKWRFDFAWQAEGVSMEVDGAVFTGGRHVRGRGFIKDCEKMSMAAVLGWRVLRMTTWDIETRPQYVIETVKAALGRA